MYFLTILDRFFMQFQVFCLFFAVFMRNYEFYVFFIIYFSFESKISNDRCARKKNGTSCMKGCSVSIGENLCVFFARRLYLSNPARKSTGSEPPKSLGNHKFHPGQARAISATHPNHFRRIRRISARAPAAPAASPARNRPNFR